MPNSERIMVAATLDEVERGMEFKGPLPCHMTVHPWFDLPASNWPAFEEGMQDIMLETSAPTIIGGSQVLFGPEQDIAVRRLDRVSRTFNVLRGFDIHAGVYRLAHVLGVVIDDTYTGVNWRPHVTDTPLRTLTEGEEVSITNLTVIQKDGERDVKVIKEIYHWEHSAGQRSTI